MTLVTIVLACVLVLGGTTLAAAQTSEAPSDTLAEAAPASPAAPVPFGMPPGTAPYFNPSITNPALSVIGWFQAVAGNDLAAQEQPFALREAELAFQAAVDPFSRADFFVAVGAEGVELEEGYLTWLALPGGTQGRLGRMRADLGKFNRTHPPETPFADRPLATVAFLGEEGLVTTGVAASALIPTGLYWDVVAEVGTVPEAAENPLFQAGRRGDLLMVGRSSVFVPLGVSADMHLGASYANASALEPLRIEGNRAQLGAADLTFRWKNPRRSIYRSFLLQVEGLAEQGSADGAPRRGGLFAYAIYQVARQWKVGARYDWTEFPGTDQEARGALGLLSWQPSEFSTLSLQGRRVRDPDGSDRDAAFLKWIFNIGPHGAHPY
jgi:hypothetical protein